MGRYQQLFLDKNRYYSEDSPVIIEAVALQMDTKEKSVLAQIKIRNIVESTILACKVTIEAYEANGVDLITTLEHSYLDLAATIGEDFGTKIPVYMPDTARKIKVSVSEVVFINGIIWKSNKAWVQVLSQDKVEVLLADSNLVDEYKRVTNSKCIYIPLLWENLFLCSCGTVNKIDSKCYNCNCSYDLLVKKLDKELLANIRSDRLEKEKQEEYKRVENEKAEKEKKERFEREKIEKLKYEKAQKHRLIRKYAIVLLALFVVIISISLLVSKIILPNYETKKAYNAALELFNNGRYEESNKAFLLLGNYKDSKDKAEESIYRLAEYYFSEECDYNVAIYYWKKIIDYSDSKDRISECEDILYKEDYDYGVSLCESGEYKAGLNSLKRCKGYKDATDLILHYSYECGKSYYESLDYGVACYYFEEAQNYKDAAEMYMDSKYNYGCRNLTEGNYIVAIASFEEVEGYKDSSEKLLESKYLYLSNLSDSTLTLSAYQYLKDLVAVNYKDSQQLYNDLTRLKAKILAINDSKDSTEDFSSIDRHGYVVIHYMVTNGIPYFIYNVSIHVKFPGYLEDVTTERVAVGEEWYLYYYPDSDMGQGTATVNIYDDSDNLLCSDSVYLE